MARLLMGKLHGMLHDVLRLTEHSSLAAECCSNIRILRPTFAGGVGEPNDRKKSTGASIPAPPGCHSSRNIMVREVDNEGGCQRGRRGPAEAGLIPRNV